jgi:hypothetical protein
MSFEEFSADRRRQQSALDSNAAAVAAAAAAAAAAATASTATGPGAGPAVGPAAAPTGNPTGEGASGPPIPTPAAPPVPPPGFPAAKAIGGGDAFLSALSGRHIFLLVIFVDLLCTILELVYVAHGPAIEASLSNDTNPTMPRVILPAMRYMRAALSYLGWITALASFGELAIYAVTAWEAKRVAILRAVDGCAVLIQLAVIASGASVAARLIVLVRAVRVAELLQVVSGELAARTARLDARYVEERQRVVLLQAALDQSQAAMARETQARTQAERAASRYLSEKDSIAMERDTLNEALNIAAEQVSSAEAVLAREYGVSASAAGGRGGGWVQQPGRRAPSGPFGGVPRPGQQARQRVPVPAPPPAPTSAEEAEFEDFVDATSDTEGAAAAGGKRAPVVPSASSLPSSFSSSSSAAASASVGAGAAAQDGVRRRAGGESGGGGGGGSGSSVHSRGTGGRQSSGARTGTSGSKGVRVQVGADGSARVSASMQ